MTIRSKIILIVLPLLLTPLILTVVIASLSARNGITIIATDFLRFKTDTLMNYSRGQWTLLEDNNLEEDSEFVSVARQAVSTFARTIVRSESELILAVDREGRVAMSSREIDPEGDERAVLAESYAEGRAGWQRVRLGGEVYVGQGEFFPPFGWLFLVLEKEEVFYAAVSEIYRRTAVLLAVSMLISMVMLFLLSSFLTRPLKSIVGVIREIITTADLSKKVSLRYRDETGELGHYFNLMTGELDKAYSQIKKFAYEAVLARNNEKKIRNIFQKYVPANVIEQFESNPETMLKGDNRILAVLFSDIRSFTTISEHMDPELLVESLNNYFEKMVDVIMNNAGIVDKYIGDAIMAFFGAPVKGENDALLSVLAGLDMIEALKEFNRWQAEHGLPAFRIGIGINYGVVTVGNIGSERKMDYTVIGDMVNLASRLEGLTKVYHVPIIVSESVMKRVEDHLHCRLLDRVVVKGKNQAVKIYTVSRTLTETQELTWSHHSWAMEMYLKRNFKDALERYSQILTIMPTDRTAKLYRERCARFLKTPPPESWKGETVMLEK
jgi:class 3 adenylate cyclase/HAMP domain-containing protein